MASETSTVLVGESVAWSALAVADGRKAEPVVEPASVADLRRTSGRGATGAAHRASSPSEDQMRGLTTSELARRQRSAAADMDWVLRDSERLGLVEQGADGRWRLTPDAELRFGRALRNLWKESERQ